MAIIKVSRVCVHLFTGHLQNKKKEKIIPDVNNGILGNYKNW